ncbi:tRNA uracil 4-sulfurtransferase ThiI [Pseudobacillus wudalianchiensis]|uniref:Probable tRNA sulfurtransferase n=1 Tax=Pseudobacillus wudalianchiensis TaxID=1743143 RepID=A0A1B9B837_9BACI|nr:tRNA uracil 4-sulfurtransferase ThiI [Bacillus wudalianchiensis]OCA92240.1 tRNA 4-thiouridine(8) synthase ThiI [Bacillus wudalianchiensis]
MNYDRILIRYGELSTKGRNRKQFITKLKKNILLVLKEFRDIKIELGRDRMFIHLNDTPFEAVKERLSNVFGIQSFSPVVRTDQNIEEMKTAALELVKRNFSLGKTFKVSARRSDKEFELDTNEINYAIGSHVLRNIGELTVDVKKPDINILVEVRKGGVFLSCEKYPGAAGLPSGASGKAMLLLSGGIDSPVAGYLMLKRGVEIEAIHFHSPPYTSERAKQKVVDLAERLTAYGAEIKLHIVPFTAIQQKIQEQVPENYTMTSTRRMMLAIADKIRQKRGGLAIVTGESLGQVASQTLESMRAINDVTSTPVLRPLIAMDKLDIIDVARKIGTHDISILPYEDCCTIFTPPSPKTRPKLEKVQHFESFVNFEEMIDEAIENMETIELPQEKENSEFSDLL